MTMKMTVLHLNMIMVMNLISHGGLSNPCRSNTSTKISKDPVSFPRRTGTYNNKFAAYYEDNEFTKKCRVLSDHSDVSSWVRQWNVAIKFFGDKTIDI